MERLVAINERGHRIGEGHRNAKLSDVEVERIRMMHEEGMFYEDIAKAVGLSVCAVGRICRYERRGQTPAAYKVVHVPDQNEA
mgnify:CR=1 FL=1